jgi:hypothetical protein
VPTLFYTGRPYRTKSCRKALERSVRKFPGRSRVWHCHRMRRLGFNIANAQVTCLRLERAGLVRLGRDGVLSLPKKDKLT